MQTANTRLYSTQTVSLGFKSIARRFGIPFSGALPTIYLYEHFNMDRSNESIMLKLVALCLIVSGKWIYYSSIKQKDLFIFEPSHPSIASRFLLFLSIINYHCLSRHGMTMFSSDQSHKKHVRSLFETF